MRLKIQKPFDFDECKNPQYECRYKRDARASKCKDISYYFHQVLINDGAIECGARDPASLTDLSLITARTVLVNESFRLDCPIGGILDPMTQFGVSRAR